MILFILTKGDLMSTIEEGQKKAEEAFDRIDRVRKILPLILIEDAEEFVEYEGEVLDYITDNEVVRAFYNKIERRGERED
jgi:hypothetical protein